MKSYDLVKGQGVYKALKNGKKKKQQQKKNKEKHYPTNQTRKG